MKNVIFPIGQNRWEIILKLCIIFYLQNILQSLPDDYTLYRMIMINSFCFSGLHLNLCVVLL